MFVVYLNCCYCLRKLSLAPKYQNECDAALLLPLALFFDDVKAEFFYVICKSSSPIPSKELYLPNGMIAVEFSIYNKQSLHLKVLLPN